MTIKIYSFLVTCFLIPGIFADPFHFKVQEPVVPFVGRHDFLQNLHEALTRKVIEKNVQLSPVTFVTGRGGTGKTETTRKYIETYADAFDNVIWIEAENELQVEKSFRALAQSKIISDQIQIESEPKENDSDSKSTNQMQKTDENISNSNSHSKMSDETIEKIYQTLGRGKRRTLMIFDNVDKIPWRFFPSDSNDAESDLVPPSILILRKKGQSSSGKGQQQKESVKWLPLVPFTDDDNINCILHYPNLHFDLSSDDMPEVKVIENARLLGQILGGVPLALKQAMSFISVGFKKHPEKGLKKYLKLLYEVVKNIDGADPSLFPVSSTSESESATLNPIFLTWKITREKLAQGFRGNFTALIMDSLPFFPSSKMSIRLLFFILSGGKEPFRDQSYHNERAILIKHAISTLHRYAIVNIDRDQSDPKVDLDLDLVSGTLSMHRELQTAVLRAFTEEDTQFEYEQETVIMTKFTKMATWILSSSQKFLEKVVQENEDLTLSELYSLVAILDRLESTADATFINGEPDVLSLRVISITRFKVGLRFQKLGNFEGEQNCRKLLRNSLMKLQKFETEEGSILKSSEFQSKIMQEVENTFVMKAEGGFAGDELPVDRDLALKSLKLHEVVLDIVTQVLGKEHPFSLVCLDKKADALWQIESPPSFRQEALAIYHIFYDVYKKVYGEKNQETVLALHKLADKYCSLGDLQKSYDLFGQVLELEKEVFGPDHPFTVVIVQNMGAILMKMGKHEEALQVSKSVLKIQQAKSEVVAAVNDVLKGEGSPASDDDGQRNAEKDMEISNLHNMASNYVRLNNHEKAYKIWEKLYNEDLKRRGPDDLKTVSHESEMARTLYTMKEYSKAMKMQLHVLEIREKVLGPDHSSTMNTKFDLANLYQEHRNYDKALELFTLVYDFRKKTLGEENEHTIATLEKLANVHNDLNNKETDHQMRTQIYITKKKLFGEEALETMNALSELATAKASMEENNPEKMKEVLEMFKKVYTTKKKILGPTHDETLTALYLFTNCQAHQGDHEKAMQQLESAYDFLVNSPDHGPDSEFTGATLHAMSHVRILQGKNGLALKLDQKALEINKKSVGSEHPNTIRILEKMAALYYSQQKYNEALKYYEESHSIKIKMYGPDSLETLETLEHIGNIHLKQNEYKKAGDIYSHLYDIRSKALGKEHAHTINALFGLGVLGNAVGRHKEALAILKQVVESKTASLTLGPLHESTIAAMENLAVTYTNLKKFEEALNTFEQVYEGQWAIWGEEHKNTVGTLQNIAICNLQLHNVDRAIELITQVYNTRLKILGPDHPETKKALDYKTSMEAEFRGKSKTEL